MGSLAQKFTEQSNVRLIDEMQNLMLAQRAYQLNSKLMETADQLMEMTNNLRHG
jgi:flagellar basal-body rod protein FlgG